MHFSEKFCHSWKSSIRNFENFQVSFSTKKKKSVFNKKQKLSYALGYKFKDAGRLRHSLGLVLQAPPQLSWDKPFFFFSSQIGTLKLLKNLNKLIY